MMKENDGLFMQCFGEIEDPRMNRQRRHNLFDIIAITMCASIAGADGWTRVASFGRSKEAWLRTFLTLPNGIPSHDTFGPVFSILESQAFQQAFQSWVCAIQERVQGVAPIDGKTARRSHDHAREKKAIHVVSAWATECSMALGEVKVDEKSNGITAIPELVRALAGMVMCRATRTLNDETSVEARYFITSLTHDDPRKIAQSALGHRKQPALGA